MQRKKTLQMTVHHPFWLAKLLDPWICWPVLGTESMTHHANGRGSPHRSCRPKGLSHRCCRKVVITLTKGALIG